MVHAVISNVTSWCPSSYPDLRHKGPQAQGFGQTFSQKQGTKKPIMSMGLFVTATRTETLMVHSGYSELITLLPKPLVLRDSIIGFLGVYRHQVFKL